MKTKLWLFFIAFGLIFTACEKDELKGPPPHAKSGDKGRVILTTDPECDITDDKVTPLIAGQHNVVGTVEVEFVSGLIIVTYNTDPGWFITETHLHIWQEGDPLPVNRGGNPMIGLFDYSDKDAYEIGNNKVIYKIEKAPDCYYIAAHAVVEGSFGSLEAFAEILPETATFKVLEGPVEGSPAYLPKIYVNGFFDGFYEGWCIELGAGLRINRDYTASVFSSNEEVPGYDADFLKKLNWLLNQDFVGESYNGDVFTYGDVQIAIWTLLYREAGESWEDWIERLGEFDPDPLDEDFIGDWKKERIEEILGQVETNYNDFEFECGGWIVIVLQLSQIDDKKDHQDIVIRYPLPCGEETAWGQGCLFEGNSWAMHFYVCPF